MLKYLILILVIAGVWYGWRYMNRKPANKTPAASPPPAQPAPEQPKVAAEDLKPCPVCGTYTTGQTCGRPECRPAP